MGSGGEPIVYGPSYSVYVRSVRLALEEKWIPYRMDEFELSAMPNEHRARHPFGKVPAFHHDGFDLYETSAIIRYIDEVFVGPPLQPAEPRRRARMNQVLSIVDAYANRPMVHGIFGERMVAPRRGRASNETIIGAAIAKARVCLAALEALIDGQPFLAGPTLSLADLHAAPIFAYFVQTNEGIRLIAEQSALTSWWATMRHRDSLRRTQTVLARN